MNSLGDHLRARRIDLGILQKQVAKQIGVHEQTITNWERNATSPEVQYIPALIRFLGYNPMETGNPFSDGLIDARRARGLTQKEMAERLGVDPSTLQDWESGLHRPSQKKLEVISTFLR